jgi:hypothetical protein
VTSSVACRDGNPTNRQLMRSYLGRLIHLLTFWSQICSFDCVVEGEAIFLKHLRLGGFLICIFGSNEVVSE